MATGDENGKHCELLASWLACVGFVRYVWYARLFLIRLVWALLILYCMRAFERYSQVITCSNSILIEQAELAGIIWVLLMRTCCILTHLRLKPW